MKNSLILVSFIISVICWSVYRFRKIAVKNKRHACAKVKMALDQLKQDARQAGDEHSMEKLRFILELMESANILPSEVNKKSYDDIARLAFKAFCRHIARTRVFYWELMKQQVDHQLTCAELGKRIKVLMVEYKLLKPHFKKPQQNDTRLVCEYNLRLIREADGSLVWKD